MPGGVNAKFINMTFLTITILTITFWFISSESIGSTTEHGEKMKHESVHVDLSLGEKVY